MKFDYSNIYTQVSADALSGGDYVICADSLASMKIRVAEPELWVGRLDYVDSEACPFRFGYIPYSIVSDSTKPQIHTLAYLVARHDDPLKEVKLAYALGKTIQQQSEDGTWHDICDEPEWSIAHAYRETPKEGAAEEGAAEEGAAEEGAAEEVPDLETVCKWVKYYVDKDYDNNETFLGYFDRDAIAEYIRDDILDDTDFDTLAEHHSDGDARDWVVQYIEDRL